ncbi:MAG: DUF2877 domain-containing protein [Armatimonadota bacterium]|nr:DUF2877 domain-containing protein [Armatimonadota bacterium]MDR7613082.1 DUF2877 domain-containing protein [Armatimonadota bacterium]
MWRARLVGRTVLPRLSAECRGGVLATFARSCYLDLDGEVVAVVAGDLPAGPFAVVVEGTPPLAGVPAGAPAAAGGDRIRIGDALEVDLRPAVPWDPLLAPWAGMPAHLDDHLALLRRLLLDGASPNGLGRVAAGGTDDGPLARRAQPALAALATGLRDRDARALGAAARELAGLGPGLTPSGDDVLTGCLLALSLWPTRRPDLRSLIAGQAISRTTRISAAYLAAAARGEAGGDWHHLRDALAESDPDAVRRAAARLLALGETSGADMLGGFLLAAQALVPPA